MKNTQIKFELVEKQFLNFFVRFKSRLYEYTESELFPYR